MFKRIAFFVILIAVVSVHAQCDSLRMTLVGSWECPTNDLAGLRGFIGKIGDYVIIAQAGGEGYEPSDSLWVIDVSTAESCSTVVIYADTAFETEPALIYAITSKEENSDSGYIYVGYFNEDTLGARRYFRVLKFKTNPLSITRMGIIDSTYYTHIPN